MLIGAMNHPARDALSEIEWMAELGLDFVDLTLEPPCAASWQVDAKRIRSALEGFGMRAVGHTAFYLPIASSFETVRRGAVDELRRCLDVFGAIGIRWMNLHPDRYTPFHDRAFFVGRNLESLRELLGHAQGSPTGLMIENLPGDFNSAEQMGEILDPLPELGLHLDIGHANLQAPHNTCEEILERYGARLRHVHLHDNKGGHADLHLPLGAGTIDVGRHLRSLKQCGYDGTISLEVFTPDRRHLAYSRDVLRALWSEPLAR